MGAALVLACAAVAAQSAPLPLLRVTDLAEATGQTNATAMNINNRGDVLLLLVEGQGALWRSSDGSLLPVQAPEGKFVVPVGLNDEGLVSGQVYQRAGDGRPFVWSPQHGLKFVKQVGDLNNSSLNAINNQGQFAGEGKTAAGLLHAVIGHRGSGARDLAPQERTQSQGSAINEAGDIGGLSTASEGCCWTPAIIDTAGHVTLLGRLSPPGKDDQGSVRALNDNGQAVGVSLGANGRPHAFVWSRDTGMVDLGLSTGPADWSEANDINSLGQVAGSNFHSFEQTTFYWDAEHGVVDVNTLLDPTDPLSARTQVLIGNPHINDRGQIVTQAVIDGVGKPVLLTPVSR